jgi:transposase
VARLLGVNRDTVGRWLAVYASRGLAQMLTIAKAPGKVPLLSPAMPQALQDRLSQPDGFASYKAIWQWLRQAYGVPLGYKPVHKFVRYTLRAKPKVPRKSHIKTPRSGYDLSGRFFNRPAGETYREPVHAATTGGAPCARLLPG